MWSLGVVVSRDREPILSPEHQNLPPSRRFLSTTSLQQHTCLPYSIAEKVAQNHLKGRCTCRR